MKKLITKNILTISVVITTVLIWNLLINVAFAFPPPSPDQEKTANESTQLCESTGGTVNRESIGKDDPETGKRVARGILIECSCPNGYSWDEARGCVMGKGIMSLYLGVGALIILILAIVVWKCKRKNKDSGYRQTT